MDITFRGTINFSVDDVWSVLRDFHGLLSWHPGLLTCESEGSGVGSVRRVTLTDGRGARERLDALDEVGHRLTYSVSESARPATNGLSACVKLTTTASGATEVEWTVTPPGRDGLPDDVVESMRTYYPSRIQNLADEVARRASSRRGSVDEGAS